MDLKEKGDTLINDTITVEPHSPEVSDNKIRETGILDSVSNRKIEGSTITSE